MMTGGVTPLGMAGQALRDWGMVFGQAAYLWFWALVWPWVKQEASARFGPGYIIKRRGEAVWGKLDKC